MRPAPEQARLPAREGKHMTIEIDIAELDAGKPNWLSPEGKLEGKRAPIMAKARAEWLKEQGRDEEADETLAERRAPHPLAATEMASDGERRCGALGNKEGQVE